jgi:putative membrane protein
LEIVSCCVFGGVTLYLVRSGKYLSYVTPRMEPYLYFTAVVMGIWALSALGRLRPQHKVRSAHCLVLAIPVLLLLLPHSPLDISDLSGNKKAAVAPPKAERRSKPPEETALPDSDAAAAKIAAASNDDFGFWLSELYMHAEQYEGYPITATGFVCKDPELLKDDEFALARLMMTCCAADLMPVGFVCRSEAASQLKAESWVTVDGVMGKVESQGGSEKYEPRIVVEKIAPARAVKGYIYPY